MSEVPQVRLSASSVQPMPNPYGKPLDMARAWDEGHRSACDGLGCSQMSHLDANPYRQQGDA